MGTINEKSYESIKAKILKLHALAERGVAGEAANALRLLNRMLEQYGVTLEQILGERETTKRYSFKATTEWQKKLLIQTYACVKECSKISYWHYKNEYDFELTAYEYAEMCNMYEWHKKQLGKEMKQAISELTEAYIYKHDIMNRSNEGSDEIKDLTAEDIKRLARILAMVDGLEDISYRKQIENK